MKAHRHVVLRAPSFNSDNVRPGLDVAADVFRSRADVEHAPEGASRTAPHSAKLPHMRGQPTAVDQHPLHVACVCDRPAHADEVPFPHGRRDHGGLHK